MQAMFVANGTIDGAGDKVLPNGSGYAAMAVAFDLDCSFHTPGMRLSDHTSTEDR